MDEIRPTIEIPFLKNKNCIIEIKEKTDTKRSNLSIFIFDRFFKLYKKDINKIIKKTSANLKKILLSN